MTPPNGGPINSINGADNTAVSSNYSALRACCAGPADVVLACAGESWSWYPFSSDPATLVSESMAPTMASDSLPLSSLSSTDRGECGGVAEGGIVLIWRGGPPQ